MKKKSTLFCGLLALAALSVQAENTKFTLEDAEGNEIAAPFYSEFSKDADGNFVIEDFLNSECPLYFKFERPNVDAWADITFTGYLDREEESPYIMDAEGNYLVGAVKDYNGDTDWTYVWYPYVSEEGYSCVYRYDMTDPDNYYEYYGAILMSGFLNEECSSYFPWTYVIFYFNDPDPTPDGIKSVDVDINKAPVYFDMNGVRVDNPSNGMFIRKQGNKVSKVAIR